jgi:hypothetical protein
MMLIDLTLVVTLVALAASALVWRLAFSQKPPACAPKASAPDVVLSPAFGRALARAAKKKHPSPSTTRADSARCH